MPSLRKTEKLLAVLCQYPEGIPYKALLQQSGLNEIALLDQAAALWKEGRLTGITQEGCCGNRCSIYCISYMDKASSWKQA